ncbi:hypothetical protein RND81_02G000600 [Saponaria officinalis]|uniref:J domain-containing protein n=1 Tax=Saponaria officinalis TaxID=3572 RepID=A0AAW1MNQ2_SAPOF
MRKSGEARLLLGFDPHSRPTLSQIKAAYKRKVWDVHPDRFPAAQRTLAESQFKLLSEAYACLSTTTTTTTTTTSTSGAAYSQSAYTRVVRSGVARPNAGARHHPLLPLPFLFIILGTLGLGGLSVARKEQESHPSHNPFLP